MGAEKDGGALALEFEDALEALAGKGAVAHGQGLVDDEDVRLHTAGHSKGQAHEHAAGVGLHWLVDEGTDVGKGNDVLQLGLDVRTGKPQDRGVEEDVFPAGELGVEASAEFQEGGNAAVDADGARRRSEGAAEKLEQGGLASAVLPDDAEDLTVGHFEADVVQGVEFVVETAFGPEAAKEHLFEPVHRPGVEVVGLGEVLGDDAGFRGHRQILCGSFGTRQTPGRRPAGPRPGRRPGRPIAGGGRR
jgi:hypothetical protein